MTNELTNQQRFSMVYTLLDHRNKIKMFKAQVEPRAVIVHEIVAKLFFFNTTNSISPLTSISGELSWKITFKRERKTNCARHLDIISMVRLHSHQP